MTPTCALQFTRWLGFTSIAVVVVGLMLALYVLQMPSASPVDLSRVLALAVLWLTNLLSLLLNSLYWFIRRWPKWLLATLAVQAAVAIIALLPLILSDGLFD